MNDLGFWGKLKKPILCLAPMADVTDAAFRQIIAKYSNHGKFTRTGKSLGGPDIFFTEFVSADGLCSAGKKKLLVDFIYHDNEHPIVAQIFGSNIQNIKEASKLCEKLGFDGIDINMGCPDRSIEKQCAGAAMMKNPKLAREVIKAAKEGAGRLPVSVKTRMGYNPPGGITSRAGKDEIDTWVRELLSEDIAALTVHLRTRKEMSDVPAHWDVMKKIVAIRNEMGVETLVLGNGDVTDLEDAKQKAEESGCDGVMLGRAIFGNPWLFANLACAKHNRQIEHPAPYSLKNKLRNVYKHLRNFSFATQSRNSAEQSECVACNKSREYGAGVIPSISEKLRVMVEHTKLYEDILGGKKNFAIMKKHYKAYTKGIDARPNGRGPSVGRGAKELRVKLMEAENAEEVEQVANDFLSKI